MEQVILIRYSEIHLKGQNRGVFEKLFMQNIKLALKGLEYSLVQIKGRYLLENFDSRETNKIIEKVKKVFGTHTLSVAYKVNSEIESIFDGVKVLLQEQAIGKQTFKIESNRADKTFPLNSMQISSTIGGMVLKNFKNLKVDVHSPDIVVQIDMRENGFTLISCGVIDGAGGLPVGSSGKGLLLLSGGIDSPVAGHMIAKRGMEIACIHFHSYPYTNLQARQKVEQLAKLLAGYTGKIALHVVSVTEIQEEIHRVCREDMMITLLRRFMIRIADRVAKKIGAQTIITGENLGQVASQTIEGITSSNAVTTMPMLRPLIAFDKVEIIAKARAIGSFDISILPYEDCCTVFLPKHPLIKPKLAEVEREEQKLDIEKLIEKAIESIELVEFKL